MRKLLRIFVSVVLHKFTAFVSLAITFLVFCRTELDAASAAFAFFCAALTAAIIILATRRVCFSIYTAVALSATIVVVSRMKLPLTGMSFHAYDFFYVFDPNLILFFLEGFLIYVLPVAAVLAAALAFLTFVFVRERPATASFPWRLAVVGAMTGLVVLTLPAWRHDEGYFFNWRHISPFLVSLGEVPNLWKENPLATRLASAPTSPPYSEVFRCEEEALRPDIVLIHAESQLPPEWMTGNAPQLTDSFRSPDGDIHKFGVETYGGGSWITVTSIMAGVSGADFGWMKQFVTKSLKGRAEATVPQILKACGYETTGMLGMAYNSFSLGPFLSAAGIDDIYDPSTVGIASMFERDKAYFDAMWQRVLEKRLATQAPQFLYVETMFTHSPYDHALEPDTPLEGEPFSDDASENEFLRRLTLARQDIDEFKAAIARNPGPRGTIVIEYGDHRPLIELESGTTDLSDWRSPAYETYYAAHSYGAAPQVEFPQLERMDAAFLGYWVIEATGLASGGLVDDMAVLRVKCDGRFHLCEDRAAVDEVLRRRVDSGLLTLRPLVEVY